MNYDCSVLYEIELIRFFGIVLRPSKIRKTKNDPKALQVKCVRDVGTPLNKFAVTARRQRTNAYELTLVSFIFEKPNYHFLPKRQSFQRKLNIPRKHFNVSYFKQ